ncbi:MAG: hypothetical protein PHX68_05035 [Alphaproteobacteria bacterium]|nr:hypothetical protein [Alphaproteobacteria bacterium]
MTIRINMDDVRQTTPRPAPAPVQPAPAPAPAARPASTPMFNIGDVKLLAQAIVAGAAVMLAFVGLKELLKRKERLPSDNEPAPAAHYAKAPAKETIRIIYQEPVREVVYVESARRPAAVQQPAQQVIYTQPPVQQVVYTQPSVVYTQPTYAYPVYPTYPVSTFSFGFYYDGGRSHCHRPAPVHHYHHYRQPTRVTPPRPTPRPTPTPSRDGRVRH